MRYETVKLSDVADIIVGFAFKSDSFNTNGNGVRIVRGKNITHLALRWGNDTRWWNDFSINLDRYYLKEGDILIGMDGSLVGKNYARVRAEDLPLLLVQRVACIRAKDGTDQDFLWSCISNMRFELYINAIKTGTSIPHISGKQIAEYPIPSFSYFEQTNISAILRSLDDKIELNNAINSNLEQQAQAVYTSLFISNPNSEWKIGQLSDLVAVKYGKDHKKLKDGIYPVYGSGGIMRYVERPLYTGESVLIPRKGTLNNVIYVNGAFWSVDTMFYTEMLRPNVAKFVYHFVKSKDLASLNAGSAVPSMTTNILNAMQLRIPDDETLQQFENVVSPMYTAMQENDKQSTSLASLRDTLLPKLMSGELDVSDIDL